MSYELLLKETAALSYEEQVNLMAYLANSIQASINQAKKELQQENIQKRLDALATLSGLFSSEELSCVDDSICAGIKIKDIDV
jgi:hypothetical protein